MYTYTYTHLYMCIYIYIYIYIYTHTNVHASHNQWHIICAANTCAADSTLMDAYCI